MILFYRYPFQDFSKNCWESFFSKAAGAHLDTWAVDRPWLLGTCLQGGGDGWTIEPSQRAMVELFLGAPLAERSSDPINGGVL